MSYVTKDGRIALFVFLALCCCISVAAAAPVDVLTPQQALAGVGHGNQRAWGSFAVTLAEKRPPQAGFTKSIRLVTSKMPDNLWQHQLGLQSQAAVEKGDVLHLSFWGRSLKGEGDDQEALVELNFHLPQEWHDKSLAQRVRLTSAWQQIQIPFRAKRPIPAGKGRLAFVMGIRVQTVDIADVRLVNYGPAEAIADLPRSRETYRGQEPDAAWRAQAAERIERIRKGDFTVKVTDNAGKAVPGAQVRVAMKKHSFKFGSTVSIPAMTDQSADGEQYRKHVEELFNHVSVENGLKWKSWDGYGKRPDRRAAVVDSLKWLKARDIAVHGHVLVWPGWSQLPSELKSLENKPDELAKRVDEHIVEMVELTKPFTYEWDVVNEAFTNNDLQKVLGEDVLAHWFEVAHQTNPNIRLYYNDYAILAADGQTDTKHQQFYDDLVQSLLAKGAPLQGLGIQGHFRGPGTPPQTMLKILDRFGRFKLPIQITEFDIDADDEQVQADYLRDTMTVVFSHPAVNGFVMWGFWEGRHWRPRAALFRKDWSAKPNGEMFRKLVFEQWWTDVKGRSNSQGVFAGRGFFGEYEVEAIAGGRTVRKSFTLEKDGAEVTVPLAD